MNKSLIYVFIGLIPCVKAAVPITDLNVNFTESAFTSGAFSGSESFNIINDATGAELTSDNGDLDDLTLTVTTSVPGVPGANASAEIIAGGGLRSNHGFSKSFSTTYPGGSPNNPGTLVEQTLRMQFGSHISVTDFVTDFQSLNTRGIAWEYSTLAFLKPDGTYFSAAPVIGDYMSWQAANSTSPLWDIGIEGGATGSPSLGWFVQGSTDTVTNVGTSQTASGSNGDDENFTSTNGDSVLNYNDVGLVSGTRIGGFEWTVYLEDTRGSNNNPTNWTATQTFFEIDGSIAPNPASVPEPSSALLFGLGLMSLINRRKR